MVASSFSAEEDPAVKSLSKRAGIAQDVPGSEKYQSNHMSMIFREGLSFSGFERNKVFFGTGGLRYADLSDISGADSEGDCRASVVADFDDDGDPDLFVNAAQREQHMLYRNDAAVGRSIKFRLRAREGHPDAIGAIVKLRRASSVDAQVLSCGSGFESQNASELIFGLGKEPAATVLVRWPGRDVEQFGRVEAGGRYVLEEGRGEPRAYAAKPFAFADPLPRGVRVRLGSVLEELDLLTLDGASHRAELRGNVPTLVNFWATTCSSCVAELPELARLRESGKYRLIAISLDPAGARDRVREVWSRFGAGGSAYAIGDEPVAELVDVPRLAIPLTLLVSPEGRIERILQGRIREGDL